jgi:hypothetical protein
MPTCPVIPLSSAVSAAMCIFPLQVVVCAERTPGVLPRKIGTNRKTVIDRDAARTPSAVLWGMAQRKRLNPRLTIFGNHRKESWGHQRSRRKLTLQLRKTSAYFKRVRSAVRNTVGVSRRRGRSLSGRNSRRSPLSAGSTLGPGDRRLKLSRGFAAVWRSSAFQRAAT